MIKNKSAVAQSRSAIVKAAEAAAQHHRTVVGIALRTIFLNLFSHNSERLNSARYESRWRFTVNICWRDGEPVPCPAARGREKSGQAGHQVELEFSVLVAEPALVVRMRVDDSPMVDRFPPVRLVRGYAKELRPLLEGQFGLAYPKVEQIPLG